MGKRLYKNFLWKKNGACFCSFCRKEIRPEYFQIHKEERIGGMGFDYAFVVCPYRHCNTKISIDLAWIKVQAADSYNFKSLKQEAMRELFRYIFKK